MTAVGAADCRKGEAMKHLITGVFVGLTLCLESQGVVVNDVIAPLSYVGRSTESIGSVEYGGSLGSQVSAAVALPLDPAQTIFDNGAY
jgi:hypothetical protein